MERVKVYLDEARIASVVCRNCGKSKELSFSEKEVPPASLIKCGCGNTFIVTFEKRQQYRKPLDTFGSCFVEANPNDGILIRIIDISIGGLQFTTSDGTRLELNQKLRVVFRMDEKAVNLVVAVRHIRGDNIGAEIVSIDANSKKIIGFYLLP